MQCNDEEVWTCGKVGLGSGIMSYTKTPGIGDDRRGQGTMVTAEKRRRRRLNLHMVTRANLHGVTQANLMWCRQYTRALHCRDCTVQALQRECEHSLT